jgi:hypothetical protein
MRCSLCSSLTGFDAGSVALPVAHPGVDPDRREVAALMVSAIARQATPEDLITGASSEVIGSWANPLERAEALAHVDLLAAVLGVAA